MVIEKKMIPFAAAKDYIHANYPNDPLLRTIAVALLDQLPKVDAVEVVRCKDCKHWNVHPINGKLSLGKCDKLSRGMADTWFCSFGERKRQ